MKHVAFGERNKNEGWRDRWTEKRGRKRKSGGRDGRKENERGREMTLPDVKQTVILQSSVILHINTKAAQHSPVNMCYDLKVKEEAVV